ncbi:ABC transporter substrate-binding protein [Desulfococcaceae bacterium HSG8]|nr:ABC transporter substrate-binding protein [Desulfococcaceae bacterium HSG8]
MKCKICFVCAMVIIFLTAPSHGAESRTFPVGALFPMTGPQAYYGRVMSRGARVAIDQINDAGGVEGYKLKLKITDFQNVDAMLAITGLQKMILTNKIPFLLTSFSAITLAVQPICASADIMMINGGAYSPKLANKPYLHTIRLSQDQMIPPMLRYLWEMNVRRLGLIYLADPSGEVPVENLVKPIWTKMGGTIAAAESHQSGLTDYTPHLERIKAGQPDAIYCLSPGQDQAFIVRQAREMGLDVPMSIVDWNDDFQAIAGKTSENLYIPGDYFDTRRSDPVTQEFVRDYEKKWKESPDFYAANYYDAVYHILAELIRRVVRAGGNPLDGEALEKAIGQDPSFNTVYGGRMKLNQDGSSDKPMVIFKIIDGKKKVDKQVTPE